MSDPNIPILIDDDILRSYLSDSLPAGHLARVEKALRESSELRARLEEVRLEALDPAFADYLTFHLEVVECPFCQANLADLQIKASQPASEIKGRQNRILKSSQHLLGEEGRG